MTVTTTVLTIFPLLILSQVSFPIHVPDVVGAALEKALTALINYLTQIRPTMTEALK